MRFAARAARLPRTSCTSKRWSALASGPARSLPPGRLSAGQRRRVALAVLLARRPQLWLLDEPHAGLDAEHRELLDGLLKEVTAAGATVIAASHEERTSEVLADRVGNDVGRDGPRRRYWPTPGAERAGLAQDRAIGQIVEPAPEGVLPSAV